MKTWLKMVSASVVTAIVIAVVFELAREYGVPTMKQHLLNLAVAWMPIWVGAAGGLVVWVVLTVHRIAKGRDTEFQLWLKDREREVDERYEQNFRDREATAVAEANRLRGIADRISTDLEGRLQRIEGQIDAL